MSASYGGWAVSLAVTVLAVVGGLAFGRPALAAVARQWRSAIQTRAVKQHWSELAESPARLGDSVGTVIIEFADYQCPYCRKISDTLQALALRNHWQVAYHHFPLTAIHRTADGAARTAICAAGQGRFQEMHRYLMSHDRWQSDTSWRAAAAAVGVPDLDRFMACRVSSLTDRVLTRDIQLAQDLRLEGTPSFVTPRGVYTGTTGFEQVSSLASEGAGAAR